MNVIRLLLEFFVVMACSLIISTGTGFLQAYLIFFDSGVAYATAIFVAISGTVLGTLSYYIVRKVISVQRIAALMLVNFVVGYLLFSFLSYVTGLGPWTLPFSTLTLIPTSIIIRMIPED